MDSRMATDVTKTAAYHASSRNVVLRRKLAGRSAKAITRAPHRADEVVVEIPVDLRAQPAHVGLDDRGVRVEMEIPHALEQHGARHHLPGVAHQVLEQPELLRLQLDA